MSGFFEDVRDALVNGDGGIAVALMVPFIFIVLPFIAWITGR